jgi:hypothetical protein
MLNFRFQLLIVNNQKYKAFFQIVRYIKANFYFFLIISCKNLNHDQIIIRNIIKSINVIIFKIFYS